MTQTKVSELSVAPTETDLHHFPTTSRPLLWSIVLTLLISIFLRISSILNLGNILYDADVNSILLYSIVFGAQFIMGTALIVIILPPLMSDSELLQRIRTKIRRSPLLVASGLVSGGIFLFLAFGVSEMLGVAVQDWSVLIAMPDVYVDPDVTGWFYFILALIPAIFEEIVFRGIILFQLRDKYSDRTAIFLSSLLFSLYHFSVILVNPIDAVIGGVIMSFFFGLAWGTLVLKTDSILPTMIAHYIIDTIGIVFLNIDDVDPVLATQFMITITLLYPIIHWIVFRLVKRGNIEKAV